MITEEDAKYQVYSTKIDIFDVDLWYDGGIVFDVRDFTNMSVTIEDLKALVKLAEEFIKAKGCEQ
jgi:hypothetical protein